MVLVLLGTQNNSFHRLLEEVDKLMEKEVIKDEVIVQSGHTKYESKNMKVFNLISKEELDNLQEKADIIITHGGVGSIISSVKLGKKVIAVPRLSKYKEHVNDHQKDIVSIFDKKGYIIGLDGIEELENAFERIKEFVPNRYEENNEKMLSIISDFIDNV